MSSTKFRVMSARKSSSIIAKSPVIRHIKASDHYHPLRFSQKIVDNHILKIQLIGEAVLLAIKRGEFDESVFRYILDSGLTRPVDRALFDLD
ncbi:hypothetical protein [Burkholderia alba]|uniref:hypothetical protein n=1 Tax=Burkholderia alba TaxID=2683677 RepID=UPI002B05ADB3|nr:hypothetical protein [Burkholderia alba]